MKISNKYWRIARRLQTQQLQKNSKPGQTITDHELFELDIGKRGSSLFLGFYSNEGIRLALEKYGVYEDLKHAGYSDIITEVETNDPYKHRLAFYHQTKSQKNLVIDLVLRKHYVKVNMPFPSKINGKTYQSLAIDWLCMQNIKGKFSEEYPRLPGQKYPGLGMSSKVVELLMIICWRLGLSSIVNIPEHYHNAYFYSRIFFYLNPDIEAQFNALKNAFKNQPLYKISWGIDWGCVIDINSETPFKWFISTQLIPIEKELKELMSSKKYREYVNNKSKEFRFAFDEDKYKRLSAQISEDFMEKTI
jgi:hypothetical protein